MSYKITLNIEDGSPEDRVLKTIADPDAFILTLVRSSATDAVGCTENNSEEIDVVRTVDQGSEFFANFSDEKLKLMQSNAKRMRSQGLARRA